MPRRHANWGIAIVAALTASSCLGVTDLDEDVTLSVRDPEIALVNDRVRMSASVTIANSSLQPVAYDTCDAGFQRLTAEGWRFVSRKICFGSHQLWVNPGTHPIETWSSNQAVGAQADPPFEGEYRFAALIMDADLKLYTIASEVFVVEAVGR